MGPELVDEPFEFGLAVSRLSLGQSPIIVKFSLVFGYLFSNIYTLTYLPTYLPAHLPTYLPTYLPSCPPTYPPSFQPTYPPISVFDPFKYQKDLFELSGMPLLCSRLHIQISNSALCRKIPISENVCFFCRRTGQIKRNSHVY